MMVWQEHEQRQIDKQIAQQGEAIQSLFRQHYRKRRRKWFLAIYYANDRVLTRGLRSDAQQKESPRLDWR